MHTEDEDEEGDDLWCTRTRDGGARLARGVTRGACQQMDAAVWFSQSLYMMVDAVTVHTVKST